MIKKIVVIALVAAGLTLGIRALVNKAGPVLSSKPVAAPKEKKWTAEEIAADPESYMLWAGARVDEQVKDRNDRMETIKGRLAQIKERQKSLSKDLQNAENIARRMQQAITKADDEERWPAVVMGKSFDKPKAEAVIAAANKFAEDRRPLTQSYVEAVARMEAGLESLRQDVKHLNDLREKMNLDLESVRLSKNVQEVGKLRETEEKIAGYSKAVGAMADDSLPAIPAADKPKLNIEELLK